MFDLDLYVLLTNELRHQIKNPEIKNDYVNYPDDICSKNTNFKLRMFKNLKLVINFIEYFNLIRREQTNPDHWAGWSDTSFYISLLYN